MSIDSYFCFCCLSTNDLTTLFSENAEINYVTLLKQLFSIKPSQDYQDDSYICEECIGRLKEAHTFRNQVFDTINVLQVNRLIEIRRVKGDQLIQRVTHEESDKEIKDGVEYDNKYEIEMVFNKEDNKQDINLPQTDSKTFKQEIDLSKLENVQIIEGANLIRDVINNDPVKALERDIHRETKTVQIESYEVTEDLKCTLCGTESANVYMYHKHMNEHFPNHVCEMCGKGYLTERRLKRHMMSHDKGPFHCEDCQMVFSNYNTCYAHRKRVHSSVLQYSCPRCPARFPTYTRRALHLQSEHDHRPAHACPVCRQTFLVAGNLSVHMRSQHMKVKRFFCKQCDAAFFHKQDFLGHMAVHTGKNLYHCALCSKSYPRKKALKVHMRTHIDDKPFCCDVCGKKFTQKCTLMTHLKTHSRTDKKRKNKSKEKAKVLDIPKVTLDEAHSKVSDQFPGVSSVEIDSGSVSRFTPKVTSLGESTPNLILEEVPIPNIPNSKENPKFVRKECDTVVELKSKAALNQSDKSILYNCYKLFY